MGLTATAVEIDLGPGFTGDAIVPGDPRYEDARQVFNAMIDRRPALIARCRDGSPTSPLRSDTRASASCRWRSAAAATAWSARGLRRRPRGRPRADEADRGRRRRRGGREPPAACSGASSTGRRRPSAWHHRWAHATTGITGLTLGSGSGWLERKHGFTRGQPAAAELVTADGEPCGRMRRSTRTCSGRCAAAAATSAS